MKLIQTTVIALFSVALVAPSILADENHEIIEKVMKDGLKDPKDGDSPMSKLLDGKLDEAGTKSLVELVKTMHGTKAPVGNQDGYDEKVKEMIEALEAVAGGDTSVKAIERLDNAQNCKACHSDHKPKKKG